MEKSLCKTGKKKLCIIAVNPPDSRQMIDRLKALGKFLSREWSVTDSIHSKTTA